MASERIKGFDGLRAFAVSLVFLMHKTSWGTGANLGFYGVWLFFLLSGFLIISQLHAARLKVEAGTSRSWHEIASFWYRRSFRIFPAYYFLIFLVAALYTAVGRDIPGFWFHATYTSNIYFAYFTDDFVTTWAHFWSLAVEEQFYILFAPLIIFSRSVYTGVLCLAVVLVSLIVRFVLAETAVLPYVVYIDSMVNFGLLALGGILYLYRERLARWLRIGSSTSSVPILLVLAVYLLSIAFTARFSASDGAVRQLLYVISVAIGALLLFQIYSSQGSAVVRALEWKPWVHYGRMSYGVYLYNSYVPNDLPVRLLDMAARRGPSALRPAFSGLIDAISASGLLQDAAAVLGFVVCFAVTFAITQASWTLIEQPALGWRARLPQLRLRSAPPAPVADSER